LEAAPKTKCSFEGALLYHDEEPRVVQGGNFSSPQKRKTAGSSGERVAIDLLLVDKTGPLIVNLWDDAVRDLFKSGY
jgi:hypothetical protein